MQHDLQQAENVTPMAATEGQATSLVEAISRAASDPSTDVDKMERLWEMHERITAKSAEQTFNASMTQAQSEIGRVSADATNPQTRSNYATYAALDKALRPVYTKHGFSLSFDTGDDAPEGHVRVLCYVSHRDGHSRTYHADMPADGLGAKGNAVMTKTHARGSAFSYGMRYLLKLIFNVAIGEDDDDGNGANPTQKLSDEQIANIDALIEETGADRQRFISWIGGGMCSSLSEVPATEYRKGVAMLEKKRKEQK